MSDLKEEVKPYVNVVRGAYLKYLEEKAKVEKIAALDLDMESVDCFISDETFVNVDIRSQGQGQRYHFTFEAIDFS